MPVKEIEKWIAADDKFIVRNSKKDGYNGERDGD